MKKQQYIQLNSIILPLLIMLVLAGGLFVSLPLLQKTQVFKSRASAARGFIALQATRTTIEYNQTTEVAVTLNPGGSEIVAADLAFNFDKNYLELTDIILKSDSANNRLTTYIPKDQNGFRKDRVIQNANSSGRVKFGAVCFSETGCPQGQTQILDQNNPLAILVFKALRQGNTNMAVLVNPQLATESNLFTRTKENIVSNSQPLALVIAQPTLTIPVTTLTLSKTSGFVRGEEIKLSFDAKDNASSIHTSLWNGVTDLNQRSGEGSYQGFPGSGGSRMATVPFYVEYLATGPSGKEQMKNLLVTEGAFIEDKGGVLVGIDLPDGVKPSPALLQRIDETIQATPKPTVIPIPTVAATSKLTPTSAPVATCSKYYSVWGHIKDSVYMGPVSGVTVEVWNDKGAKRTNVTSDFGIFGVDDFICDNGAYAVRVPNQSGISNPQTYTTSHAWNFAGNLAGQDTPVGSYTYEFQMVGSNDCAGPDTSGRKGRCDFKVNR